MRLLLIRHGQILSNVRGVLDTAVPGPELTAIGEEQARAVPGALAAGGFGAEEIGAIWVSSALRAQQTAVPLAQALGLEPVERHGIREVSAGDLEMSGTREDISTYIGAIVSWASGDLACRIPGGEDGAEFFARYDAVVDEVVAEAESRGLAAAAIVSHGAAIRCWAATRSDNLSLGPTSQLWLENTGVVVLERTADGWTCLSWMGDPVSGVGADEPAGPTGEAPADAGRRLSDR
ncbi:MAG: histidine phosphatase family protein [Naasia sp.]|nr:histidine phosphatase family protein [Naasia sp.]